MLSFLLTWTDSRRSTTPVGHEAGDHLMIDAAHRVFSHIRETDTVARIGLEVVQDVLDNIALVYGDPRYLCSPFIQRKVLAGSSFRS